MKKLYFIVQLLLLGYIVHAQKTVTGTVADQDGLPLIGATVMEVNTTTGTVTDIDGTFSLTVSDAGTELMISYTGFANRIIPITNATDYEITLAEDAATLDEVVVIGYGTTSKRFLTDNVAKLTEDDIEKVPVPNFQTTMAGKAAGVRVAQVNGKVDAGISVRVRGAASISAGSDPLYVLDGVPLVNDNESSNGAPMNPLLSLSPSEIESIDILKDASSAAIYGARGANGVVLITTKRGRIGRAQMTLNISNGWSQPTNLVEWLDSDEYVELFLEAAENADRRRTAAGLSANRVEITEDNFDRISNNTDWRAGEINTTWNDVVFRNGHQRDANFGISGGDEKTTYYLGGAANDTEGILIGNELERYSGRTNIQHNFSDKFTGSLNLGYSKTTIERVQDDNSFTTPLQAIAQAPISPPRLADGTPFRNTEYANFLLALDFGNYTTRLRRLTGKASGVYRATDWLSFTTDFGYDMSYQTEDSFNGSQTPFQSTNGDAFNSNVVQENYVWANYATLEREFGDQHAVSATVGTEYTDAVRSFSSVNGIQFPSDDLQTISSAAEITAGAGTLTEYTFMSYFARAQYIFAQKYFVKGSIRYDGGSRFGADFRYGAFPAGSVGWIVSQEPFLVNNRTLSFLKARVSYGQLGNSEIGNFASRNLFGGTAYNQRPGLQPIQPGNDQLTWETTTQLDVGLEFGLFDGRVSGELDYYNKDTDGLLFSVPLPGTSGNDIINRNIGRLINSGVEVILNVDVLPATSPVSWNSSFNWARNTNEIESLPNNNADIIVGTNINRTGEAVLAHYLIEYAGVDPDNGDALYFINDPENPNRETTNNPNAANRIIAGEPFPTITTGWTNTISIEDLTLSFTFLGEFGTEIYNAAGRFQSANARFYDNQTVDQLDRWQNPGDITDVPEARLFEANGTAASTRYLESADFIRLRNITLSYNLPKLWMERIGITNTQVYVTGLNLLTFTDFSGYDPEVRYDAVNLARGQQFYSAPSPRTVSVGLNLSF